MDDILVSECGGIAREEDFIFSDEEEAHPTATEPCSSFELDLSAKLFGTCKCGFSRKDHHDASSDVDMTHVAKLKPAEIDSQVATDSENVKPMLSPNRFESTADSSVQNKVARLKEVFSSSTADENTRLPAEQIVKPQMENVLKVSKDLKLQPQQETPASPTSSPETPKMTPTSAMKFRGNWTPVINDPVPQQYLPTSSSPPGVQVEVPDESAEVVELETDTKKVSETNGVIHEDDKPPSHTTSEELSPTSKINELATRIEQVDIATEEDCTLQPLQTVSTPPQKSVMKTENSKPESIPRPSNIVRPRSPVTSSVSVPKFRSTPIDETTLPRFMRATASSRNRTRTARDNTLSVAVQDWSKSLR